MTKEREHMTVNDLLALIAKLGAAGVVIIAVGTWGWKMADSVSTDSERSQLEQHLLDNHDHDISEVITQLGEALAPIQKSLENQEVEDVISRITRLMNIRCEAEADGREWTLGDVLGEVKDRYQVLEGRNFADGSCVDGRRVVP